MFHRFATSIARHRRAVGFAVAVVAIAVSVGPSGLPRAGTPVIPVQAAPPPLASAEPPESTISSLPTETPIVDAALLSTPEAQAHFALERFQARARAFFAQAASLDAAVKAREAHELAAAVDTYEARRVLSAGEAMSLRIGLVEATAASPAERADGVAAIVARYESDGRQREARWLAQQAGDAAFLRYKARESAVVAEVMAMAQIPGGLGRDEYLRRRLEAERVAAMQ